MPDIESYLSEVESHLDDTFKQYAESVAKEMAGKTYQYKLVPLGHMIDKAAVKSGTCTVENVWYDKDQDCNVYRLIDCDTKVTFNVDQFEVELTPIEG